MAKQLIAGNWKMNGTLQESLSRVTDLIEQTKTLNHANILICPPFCLINPIAQLVKNTNILLGAQDCHTQEKGAFTGNISAVMLKDAGCQYVLVGHSERRTYQNESNAEIQQKVQAAINAGLIAVLCIGETKEEKEAGNTIKVLQNQLKNGLPSNATAQNLIIAYEPVWAIGTGLVPTNAEIEENHTQIKQIIAQNLGQSVANSMQVLYGGSLNAKNCNEILPLNNVNGGLIGGASLINADFVTIINNATKV